MRLVRADSLTKRSPHTSSSSSSLRDHAIAVAHQVDEHVEDLRLDRDRMTAPSNLEEHGIDLGVAEEVRHADPILAHVARA